MKIIVTLKSFVYGTHYMIFLIFYKFKMLHYKVKKIIIIKRAVRDDESNTNFAEDNWDKNNLYSWYHTPK